MKKRKGNPQSVGSKRQQLMERGWDKGDGRDDRKQFEEKPHPGSFAAMEPEPEQGKTPESDAGKETDNTSRKEDSRSKKKVAILLGYCGSGYMGMQMNPGAKTIEAELERALYRAGLMIKQNYGFIQKLHFMRAARTDKGVHAVTNIVSLKLLMDDGDEEAMKNKINGYLPETIRVHQVFRVSKMFHAKNACTKRRYQYILPTYMLADESTVNAALADAYRELDVEDPQVSASAGAAPSALDAEEGARGEEEKAEDPAGGAGACSWPRGASAWLPRAAGEAGGPRVGAGGLPRHAQLPQLHVPARGHRQELPPIHNVL